MVDRRGPLMAATTPPEEPTDRPTAQGSTIEVIPPLNIQTKWDRQAVLIEVDEHKAGLIQTAGNCIACAVRDIYASKTEIDHTEYFAWNCGTDVVFALTAFGARIQDSTQRTFADVFGDAVEMRAILQLVLKKVNEYLPESLEASIGPIPFGMFGRPSVTTRLVMTGQNQKITHADKTDDAGITKLVDEYKDEPWLYYVHTRRNTGAPESFEYQITARISLFDPQYRISSASDYVSTLQYGRQADPVDAFEDLGVSSSLSQIDDQYGIIYSGNEPDVISRTNTPLKNYAAELDMITGDAEYEEIKRGRYGASDKLESICSFTSVLARETDLKRFMTLGAASPDGDPSANFPTVNPLGVDKLGTDLSEIDPEPVLISADPAVDPNGEITSQRPSTANDGTKLHWQAIIDTALALESDGYDTHIVRQDTGSRPDLWARHPDGEIFAVEVECQTRSKPASVLTNIARQAVWGYKTISVIVPQKNNKGQYESLQTIGEWALDKFAKPFYADDGDLKASRTKLHTHTADITIDGKTMLLPAGVDHSDWWITPDNRCLLLDGRTIIAEGDVTDPIEEFTFSTPRYYTDGDLHIAESDDGERLQTCADKSDIDNKRISPPYRAVDLSYIEYVDRIYCYDPDNRELVEHDMTADWDTSKASPRHEKSHEDAFSTFVVDREGARLMEAECRPFIRAWIDSLSAHGAPAINVFGEYRKKYYGRSGVNDTVGKIHHYPDAAFRFERGLVSPDTQGLSTKPSFPDDWEIDPEDILREPLVYGLDDIRDVGATGRREDD